MINIEKGELCLLESDISINPVLKKSEVYNSRIYKEYLRNEIDIGNSFYWFHFKLITLLGVEMYIGLCFYGEHLNSVHMAIVSNDFGTSWNDWSKEKELERKKAHDSWLLKNIGNPPYVYNWGTISSVYDNKGAVSKIIINFNKQ